MTPTFLIRRCIRVFKRLFYLIVLCICMLGIVGCRGNEEEVKILTNDKGEVLLVDDDLVAISVVDKAETPLGASVNIRVVNKSNYDIVVQCNETLAKTLVDNKVNNPLFNIDIPVNGERVKPMTFMGVKDVKDLVKIEGVFTVNSIDFNTEFGEYAFFID